MVIFTIILKSFTNYCYTNSRIPYKIQGNIFFIFRVAIILVKSLEINLFFLFQFCDKFSALMHFFFVLLRILQVFCIIHVITTKNVGLSYITISKVVLLCYFSCCTHHHYIFLLLT